MNLLPVIARELRAQSRQGSTYALRWMSVLPLLGLAVFLSVGDPFQLQEGALLFAALQTGLLLAIVALVPAMVADTLSRERREGTLHLLFLTPLRTVDVVLAKGFASVLQAGMPLLASVPVLVTPFLLGGIDWQQAVLVVAVLFASFLLAVSCSLLGSSRHNATHRSLAMSYALLGLGMLALCAGVGFLVERWGSVSFGFGSYRSFLARCFYLGWRSFFEFAEVQSLLNTRGPGGASVFGFWAMTLEIIAMGVLFSIPLLLLAGRNVRRFLADSARSRAREHLERVLFTPRVALGVYRRWMRRNLERNPVGWLEQRTWQARLVSWSWLTVMLVIYSSALADPVWLIGGLDDFQRALGYLLLFSIALTAAASFRRERETGVLEILLVSPLSARELVWGRLRGMWRQFMPAFALFMGVWIYLGAWRFGPYYGARSGEGRWLLEFYVILMQFAVIYAALPVVGLFWSLRTRHYLTSVILTTLALGVNPVLAVGLDSVFWWYARTVTNPHQELETYRLLRMYLPLVVWLVGAWYCGQSLVTHLDRRRFVLRGG